MHTPGQSLLAGVQAANDGRRLAGGNADSYDLGWLASCVGHMLCADKATARRQRAELLALMNEGHRLLTGAEGAAKAAAAPKAICGHAAAGLACEGVNIRDCAGCIEGGFIRGREA